MKNKFNCLFLHVILSICMTSALPTLSKKRHASHDIHHQIPSIITPGKSVNINASKAGNLQSRCRMPLNHNHQRVGNNFVLPPLENGSIPKSINQENINISNSFPTGLKDHLEKPIVTKPKDDGFLDSRYSDNDDGIIEDSEKIEEEDDEGGDVFDADPTEFGVTITKL